MRTILLFLYYACLMVILFFLESAQRLIAMTRSLLPRAKSRSALARNN